MNFDTIHSKLAKQCPFRYRVNEIIPFAYPYRKLKVQATISIMPERATLKVYAVFLKAIKQGFNTEQAIREVLSLDKDDFLLRELFVLKEQKLVDIVSGQYFVTDQGGRFLEDNSMLKVTAIKDIEVMLDELHKEVVKGFSYGKPSMLFRENKLTVDAVLKRKDPALLDGQFDSISEIVKQQSKGDEILVDLDNSMISHDESLSRECYLIEYLPLDLNEGAAFIEVRYNDNSYSKDKRLTELLSHDYPDVLYRFTSSERKDLASLYQIEPRSISDFEEEKATQSETSNDFQHLSVWEVQAKFIETIKEAKSRILIESPWVGRAVIKHLESIESALNRKVQVIILYGVSYNDDHHDEAVAMLEELQRKHKDHLYLVHLPSHFEENGVAGLNGTHRKLIIKDNDYYILGSYNFLSFNKELGQQVANEESIVIATGVNEKWNDVVRKYKLKYS